MYHNFDAMNSIGLLVSDAQCYREICLLTIEGTKQNERAPLTGVASGYGAIFNIQLMRDMTIVAYEGLKLISAGSGCKIKDLLSDCSENYYEQLKFIRNNMHLYNKHGAYAPKATSIIEDQHAQFGAGITDEYSYLRNDISLAYEMSNPKKVFLGSNYNIFHAFFGKNGMAIDEQMIGYAKDTAALISSFASLDEYNIPKLTCGILKCDSISIELFDYKSDLLFEHIPLERTIVFRLLLLVLELSYIDCFIKTHVDMDALLSTDIWLCFFNKWVACKYDEVFDSLDNVIKYSNDLDQKRILKWLAEAGTDITKLKHRTTAQALRNMLHYSDNDIRVYPDSHGKPDINISGIYAYRTGLITWNAFQDNLVGMLDEIHALLDCLRTALAPVLLA